MQRVLEINTKSVNQLLHVLFNDVPTVRIANSYTEPRMATDLFEADLDKLDQLYQRGITRPAAIWRAIRPLKA